MIGVTVPDVLISTDGMTDEEMREADTCGALYYGWVTAKTHARYCKVEREWLRRHRFRELMKHLKLTGRL